MSYNRYSLIESKDGSSWAVADIFTGLPAVLAGMTLDGMDVDEAATAVDLMNAADWQKRILYAVQGRGG
ncbi:MAG: hypothetical protein EON56_02780 [Alphaproteobacteria bacterium]|nr:MAG: hypothetical protein EON56_02780 [Alphaproteobacteria bacterium]